MDISISGLHMSLSDELRDYATSKFERVERIYHGILSIEIILKNDDRKRHCEVIIHTRHQKNPVIDACGDEFNEAIDLAVDKAERQLRRLKEKSKSHRRKEVRPSDVAPASE